MRVLRKTILVFTSIALLVGGFCLGVIASRSIRAKLIFPAVINDLGSLFTFKILGERYDILFENERVLFQVFESSGKNGFIPFTITKADYPKLFEQGSAESSFFNAIVVNEDSKPLIEVSNNYHDHGSFSPAYTLVVDPKTGTATVKE